MPVYFDEKTKTYYASFYYRDYNGERKRKLKRSFKLARDAKKFEQDFLAKMAGTPDMTFEVLVNIYLEDASARLKVTTINRKKYMINTHIIPAFGNIPVNEITPTHIRKWQNSLLKTDLADTYMHSLCGELSTIFNYAVKFHNLSSNPSKICGSIKVKKKPELNFYTLDEFNRFIVTLNDDITNQLVFTTLFYTGLRCGELLALTPQDIDFNNNTITVNKTYTRILKSDIVTAPKTAKSNRTISIPHDLCEQLKNYLDSFFEAPPSRIFELTNKFFIRKALIHGAKEAHLKLIRIHDFRHSHASLLINLGVQPLAIKDRLGHEDIKTTLNIYSHLYPDTDDKLTAKLDNLFK